MHYKKKLRIIKSIYNLYFIWNFDLLKMIKIQTNDKLILIDNIFASNKKETIKIAKIMIKNCKYFIFV